MKIKAVKTIATCITSGNEYEVLKEGDNMIVVGDDGYAIGLSKEHFAVKEEKKLTPVEWLSEELLHLDIDFELGMSKEEFHARRREVVSKAKVMEQQLINKL